MPKLIKETLKSYFAGIVDGEGCVEIRCCKSYNCPDKHKRYYTRISVSNKHYKVLKLLKDSYGGHLIYFKKRNIYTWAISTKQSEKFLNEIYPYLIIKKNEAKIIKQFSKIKIEKELKYKKVPPKIQAFREKLRLKLKSMRL